MNPFSARLCPMGVLAAPGHTPHPLFSPHVPAWMPASCLSCPSQFVVGKASSVIRGSIAPREACGLSGAVRHIHDGVRDRWPSYHWRQFRLRIVFAAANRIESLTLWQIQYAQVMGDARKCRESTQEVASRSARSFARPAASLFFRNNERLRKNVWIPSISPGTFSFHASSKLTPVMPVIMSMR